MPWFCKICEYFEFFLRNVTKIITGSQFLFLPHGEVYQKKPNTIGVTTAVYACFPHFFHFFLYYSVLQQQRARRGENLEGSKVVLTRKRVDRMLIKEQNAESG
jgi:hypothetical protein